MNSTHRDFEASWRLAQEEACSFLGLRHKKEGLFPGPRGWCCPLELAPRISSLGLRPERAFCLCKDATLEAEGQTAQLPPSSPPPSPPVSSCLLNPAGSHCVEPGKCSLQGQPSGPQAELTKQQRFGTYSSPCLSKHVRLLFTISSSHNVRGTILGNSRPHTFIPEQIMRKTQFFSTLRWRHWGSARLRNWPYATGSDLCYISRRHFSPVGRLGEGWESENQSNINSS